jgi:hypothetical protein
LAKARAEQGRRVMDASHRTAAFDVAQVHNTPDRLLCEKEKGKYQDLENKTRTRASLVPVAGTIDMVPWWRSGFWIGQEVTRNGNIGGSRCSILSGLLRFGEMHLVLALAMVGQNKRVPGNRVLP